MNLTPEEQTNLAAIEKLHNGDIKATIIRAYEDGLLMGAMRAAQRLVSQELLNKQAPNTGGGGDGDEDDDNDTPLTASDRMSLQRLGIDPDKKFRLKNSTFTITGYKPSRWKYPVSAQNQNGRRFKFTADGVKRHQAGLR